MASDPAILEHTLDAGARRVLHDFARRLRERWGEALERVAVFGSCARGDATEESDVDVMVVLRIDPAAEDGADGEAWALLAQAKAGSRAYLPVSLFVFSETRFLELLARERRFAMDVEAEGIRL